jgi:hypothetical protein
MKLAPNPADYAPVLTEEQAKMCQDMSPGKRLEMALEMSDEWHRRIVADVRSRHPDYTDQQVRMAVLYLQQGKEIFQMVYPGIEIEP